MSFEDPNKNEIGLKTVSTKQEGTVSEAKSNTFFILKNTIFLAPEDCNNNVTGGSILKFGRVVAAVAR